MGTHTLENMHVVWKRGLGIDESYRPSFDLYFRSEILGHDQQISQPREAETNNKNTGKRSNRTRCERECHHLEPSRCSERDRRNGIFSNRQVKKMRGHQKKQRDLNVTSLEKSPERRLSRHVKMGQERKRTTTEKQKLTVNEKCISILGQGDKATLQLMQHVSKMEEDIASGKLDKRARCYMRDMFCERENEQIDEEEDYGEEEEEEGVEARGLFIEDELIAHEISHCRKMVSLWSDKLEFYMSLYENAKATCATNAPPHRCRAQKRTGRKEYR